MASYTKMPDNSWSVRFRILDPDGNTMQKRLSGFDRKMDAERGYREFMASYVAPIMSRDTAKLEFTELFNYYIDYKKSRLKASSIYDITNVVEKRILPYFGKMEVVKITKLHILDWQTKLDADGFSYKYKSNLRGFLSSIFKYGVMYCDLPNNPVQQVEPFRNTEHKKEMQIWTQNEFVSFISQVDDPLYKAFFATLYFSGCRKGELLAIGWSDINFDTGILNINKSLTRKEEGKPYAISPPKNNSSIRKLLLPKNCLELLEKIKHDTNKPFVFGGDKPLAENTLTRTLQRYCLQSGVKLIRIHDFRHSHASLLISNGETILMVAKRLGHSNIEQTLNTYAHLMPNQESDMVSKINITF